MGRKPESGILVNELQAIPDWIAARVAGADPSLGKDRSLKYLGTDPSLTPGKFLHPDDQTL